MVANEGECVEHLPRGGANVLEHQARVVDDCHAPDAHVVVLVRDLGNIARCQHHLNKNHQSDTGANPPHFRSEHREIITIRHDTT